MDELFSRVDNLSSVSTTVRVNPSDRSNKDNNKKGFSNLLKEKMEEKLKKDNEEDVLILHDDETETKNENKQDAQQDESNENQSSKNEKPEDDEPVEHIDFKA